MKITSQSILLNAFKDSISTDSIIFSKARRKNDVLTSVFALSFVGYLVKQVLDELVAHDTRHNEWQLSSLLGTSLSLNTIYEVVEDSHLQVRVEALESLMALDSELNELDGSNHRIVSVFAHPSDAPQAVSIDQPLLKQSGQLFDEIIAQKSVVERVADAKDVEITVDLTDLTVDLPGRLPTVDLPQVNPSPMVTQAGFDWAQFGLEYMGLGLLALAGGSVFSFSSSGLLAAAADPAAPVDPNASVYGGTLIDGYIANAKVYRVGADGFTPLDGVVRTTDLFGRFAPLPDGSGKIVVVAQKNADGSYSSKDFGFDPTLGKSVDFTSALTLSAPGGVSGTGLVINPITTLIQTYIERHPGWRSM